MTAETDTYGGTHLSHYDLAERRTRLTWSDGFYVTYDRMVTGEVAAIRENGAASGVGVLGVYAYNDLGRVTSLTRGNGTVTTSGRDSMSRLASLAHDMAGTAHDVTSLGYDGRGNLTSSGSVGYAYDQRNMLGQAPGVALYYDPKGRLDLTWTGSTGTAFAYDGDDLFSEHDYHSWAILRRYVRGPGSDEPLV